MLQILKNNGLEIEEILENLSETEEDDELENDSNSYENISNNDIINDSSINSEISHFKSEGKSFPSNNIKMNDINKGNNKALNENKIKKLNIKKIYNNNNNNKAINIKKFKTNNTHKNKNYSLSLGK